MKGGYLPLILMMLGTSLLFFPLVPYARAASPSIYDSGNTHGTGCPCSGLTTIVNPAHPTVVGYMIVVGVQFVHTGAVVVTVTTVDGANMVAQVSTNNGNIWTYLFTGSVASVVNVNTDTVTVNVSPSTSTINIEAFEVQSSPLVLASAWNTATGTGSGTSLTTSTTNAYAASHEIVFASVIDNCGGTTAGTQYTMVAPDACDGTEWSVTAASPTSYPATAGSSGAWADVGMVLSDTPSTTTIVYQVIACTNFQLQCWWYPMFFLGIGVAPFMLIGGLGRVNSRGMTYLLLSALTFTSMVEVLMGMINIMFPLIFAILTVLYAVRGR